jgi:hypothetical protein
MKKLFIICAIFALAIHAKADVNAPDFAYPRQVIADAEQALKKSQKSNDGIGTLQALMQIAVANRSIDGDSMQYDARRVLSIAMQQKKPHVKALFDLYAATIINNIYSQRRYVYNRRQLPVNPRPTDMTEWSGDMFNAVIDLLCTLAWQNADNTDIAELARVVSADDLCRRYYPTQADFIASQILTNFTHDDALTARVQADVLTRHDKYSAAWCNWQARALSQSSSFAELMHLYFDTPQDYRSNAAVAFQYLAAINFTDSRLDDYGAELFVSQLQSAQPAVQGTWVENAVQELLNRALKPRLCLQLPSTVAADRAFDLNLSNIRNVERLTLTVMSGAKKITSKEYVINRNYPAAADTTLQFSLPQGTYQIRASVADDDYSTFTVSAVKALPQVVSNVNYAAVHVVDAVTGESLPNVSVAIYNTKKTLATSITDQTGVAKFPTDINGNVRLIQNGVSQDFSDVYLRVISNSCEVDATSSSITTDRPVYMPGDTVRWVALLSSADNVIPNKSAKVSMMSMYDSSTLASATYTTDAFGRISGEFVIADDVKAGTYGLSCDDGYGFKASFAVTDFRLQSMRLAGLVIWPLKDGADSATVSGKIVNYSDFGVDGATVECSIGKSTVQTTTDTDGSFSVVVPYPDEIYASATLSVRVVAADGSEISQSSSFRTKYPYTISLADIDYVADVSKPFSFTANVADPAKQNVDVPLLWTLSVKDGKVIKSDTIKAGANALDFSDVVAGNYTFSLSTDSIAPAQAETKQLTLYNPTRKEIPGDDCFWLQNHEPISAVSADNTISLTVGVRDDNTILYTYVDADSPKYVAHKLNAGYHTITVDLSAVKTPANTVRLYAVRNVDTKAYDLELPQTVDRKLNIVTESFRDKIYAATPESWSISITDRNGRKVQSAMALTMYDKRLGDLFNGVKSSLYIQPYIAKRDMYFSMQYISLRNSLVRKSASSLDYASLSAPQWLYALDGTSTLVGNMGRRLLKSSRSAGALYAASANGTEEIAVTSVEEAKFAAADVAATDEEVADDTSDLDDIDLRGTDSYVALWRPNLLSDANGNYNINFVVPNVNTTWQLQGFAWTKDGKNVNINRTFVAAKPIMVSINAPRFVRVGDKTEVAVTVMNNSDEIQTVKLLTQIASDSISTAEPVAQQLSDLTLAPGASQVAYIFVDASQTALINASQAYVTAKVSNGTFGDGERISVPVLPSQTLVVESNNFYINPGDKSFAMDLPAATGDNYSCSLTFTENPMWTIVESLPMLTSDDYVWNTATCQAAAYFAATVALGLNKQHPELALQLDIKDMQRVQKNSLKKLLELQYSDGSWRWGKWCTFGSKISTATVLSYMATLKRAGYLSDDANITAMIERALKFYDGIVTDTDLNYTVTRSAFANVEQSLNGKRVSNATVQWINKNWKKFDISTKAFAATALQYTGNKNMAKTLIGSLDEFGTQTPSKGFEFMNVHYLPVYATLLHAYSAIVPASEHVDGLRQYLIVRKQATNWGNYSSTSDIVAAMINSGTKWTVPAQGATVSVDGVQLDITSQGRMGTLTTTLSGSRLDLALAGNTPAYGAVISRYNAPMASVDACTDGEISIAKDMYVQRNGAWQNIDTLRVGDKVKIVLTIKASRPYSELIITDDRAATFMPKDQLAGWVYGDGISAYRENRNAATNLYISYMAKGTYKLEYEMSVNNSGTFASGIATVTCAQAPELTAHSSGTTLSVLPQK